MGWDEHRYFGRAVFEDITGKESLTYLMALSILGRELPRDCYPVLDDAACALTLADPRIWPLKLTRLVASYGSTVPAIAAGVLIEERARSRALDLRQGRRRSFRRSKLESGAARANPRTCGASSRRTSRSMASSGDSGRRFERETNGSSLFAPASPPR